MPKKKSEPQTQTYEEALDQLESIARSLEEGGLPLEESLALYARGMELSRYIDGVLKQSEQRVTLLMENMTETPFACAAAAEQAGEDK